METPGYFAVIPAGVRYDARLKANEKLLFGELSALSGKDGWCWPSNQYFADLYGVSKETVSRWLGKLQECGYIRLSNDGEERRRVIVFPEISENYDIPGSRGVDEKIKPPMTKRSSLYIGKTNTRLQESAPLISDGETEAETRGAESPSRAFQPPTLEEVAAYCRERDNGIDPEAFLAYYEAAGWMRGRTKIKSWKACVITWEKREKERGGAEEGKVWREL